MDKIRLLVIDEKKSTVEIEVDKYQFRRLGIDVNQLKEHKYKSELNSTVTNFLKSFKERKD